VADVDETARYAGLYPAIAEVARRAGAATIGLVDVTGPAGSNLDVDQAGITYSNGQSLGDPSSPVQVSCRVVGDRPVPARALPKVAAKFSTEPRFAGALPDLLAQVPASVLPVVMTTWALSRLAREGRLRFLQGLDGAATRQAVAWVSIEGVGVAPGIPTFGDRHASGHSIIGLAMFSHSELRAEAVGRCWSRGRVLRWMA
jgi:hypothetical protein